MVLVVLAVPVPVAGAQAVVAQVEASAADVAGKDTDTLKIHIFILKKGKITTENPLRRFFFLNCHLSFVIFGDDAEVVVGQSFDVASAYPLVQHCGSSVFLLTIGQPHVDGILIGEHAIGISLDLYQQIGRSAT